MSSKQGPHEMGMRTSANGRGGRHKNVPEETTAMRPRA